jgi:hypothetical protein
LFGTVDDDDAKYYNEQIRLFEQNSVIMKKLLKQLYVVKSSLGAVNNTMTDVYNENFLKEVISKVTEYMNTLRSETNANINLVNTKIEVEGHILRVTSAMNALQSYLDLLTV